MSRAPNYQGSHLALIIRLPRTNAWQPVLAGQLMQSIFAWPDVIRLAIEAGSEQIRWQIVVPISIVSGVEKSIYALFPAASITREVPQKIRVREYLYLFEPVGDFVQPLKFAEEFRGNDPLAMLIQSIGDLRSDEMVTYELTLNPAGPQDFKRGKKQLTTSTIKWWDFLMPDTAVGAVVDKAMGWDQVSRYRPQLQRLAELKLNSLLKQVTFGLRVRCSSLKRANFLAGRFLPSLAIFGREGSNYLVPAADNGHKLILSAAEATALYHFPTDQCHHPHIEWAEAIAAPLLHMAKSTGSGVIAGDNYYQGRQRQMRFSDSDRDNHVNIIGKTGTGKSTLMRALIHQDIRNGHGVGIVDPHGQLSNEVIAASIPADREKDVVLLDMTDEEYPIGLNLLAAPENVPREAVTGQALSVIHKMFAENWSSTRMEDLLYAVIALLVTVDGSTVRDIHRALYDSAYRSSLLSQVTDPVAKEFWLDEFETASPAYQREMSRPISNRIRRFYRNPKIRRLLCQPGSLDFRALLDEGKIFIANLGGLSTIEAETIGALIISKFQIAAMSRSLQTGRTVRPFYLHVDEVQNYTTTSLPVLFSEARKYGLSLCVANQFLDQLEGQTLEAVMGNVGTSFIFRTGIKDAHSLTPYVQPQFQATDLANLNLYTSIVKMQSQGRMLPAFTLATPKPIPIPHDAASRIERIKTSSRNLYAQHRDVVDELLRQRDLRGEVQGEAGQIKEDGDEYDFFG